MYYLQLLTLNCVVVIFVKISIDNNKLTNNNLLLQFSNYRKILYTQFLRNRPLSVNYSNLLC